MYALIFTKNDIDPRFTKNHINLRFKKIEGEEPYYKHYPLKYRYQSHLTAYWDGYTLHIDKIFNDKIFLREHLFKCQIATLDRTIRTFEVPVSLNYKSKFTPQFIYENWFRLSI